MIMRRLMGIFHPEQFQGWGKKRKYFEGWYFKIINADHTKAFAFIPGIAIDSNGLQQSFIQILDGKKETSEYLKFDISAFQSETGKFEIKLAENFFSRNKLVLNLPTVQGQLTFTDHTSWPSKWYSPGIMGPFSFVPFMECNHGIVSMNHTISGYLTINGEIIDFSNGKGYIEKDWGHSFPSAYIWMQSNHFSTPDISIKVSVAKIPWLGSSFVGFIAGILVNKELIQFTTYNGTRLQYCKSNKNKVEIILENKKHQLKIKAHLKNATLLASPISGFMDGRIEESMTSEIEISLLDKKSNTIILNDTGTNAGLEVAGNVTELFTM